MLNFDEPRSSLQNGDLLKHLKGAKQGSSKLQAETDEYISSLKEQVLVNIGCT